MFSKKPIKTAAPAPAAASRTQLVRRVLANPYVGAGGAGALLLVALICVIALMGDPKAGEPVVRLSLARLASEPAPAGWREAVAQVQLDGPIVSEELFQLSEAPIGSQEAVITIPGDQPGVGLPRAPLAGLSSNGPQGPLPVISPDGRQPSEAYARPFRSDGRPRIALVIGGLGLNARATREAIEKLPPEITLSFVPYSEGLQGWIDLARESGHEVLIEAPMEPLDYPENDPGAYTLLTTAEASDNLSKLEWVMSRGTGYFGVTNYLGSRFVTSAGAMNVFAGALKARGLAFIDDGSAARFAGGVPRASADRIIDENLAENAIDQQLLALEALALQRGQSLGSGFAYPLTISQVSRWAAQLDQRGYQLAPASALMKRR